MKRRHALHAGWCAALAFALSGCSLDIGSKGIDFETHGKRDESVELVERRRFAAMIAQDIETLEPMLAEELNYTHSTGEVETKAQFLETIKTGRLRYEGLDIKKIDVHLYDDIALIIGSASARVQNQGKPAQLDVRYTDAYVHRDGRWQLIAWQSTRVP
jgi:hypothetical protein